MQRFQFRLEKVLKLRIHAEEEAQQAWGLARSHRQEQQALLENMQEERLDVLEFGYQQADRELRKAMYQYLGVMDERIEKQKSVVEEAKKREENAKLKWVTARQDRETLEKLKEKQWDLFRQEQLRRDQYLLDDLARNSALQQP